MIKTGFLFLLIVISYIHCDDSTTDFSDVKVPFILSSTDAQPIDVKNTDLLKSLSSFDLSTNTTTIPSTEQSHDLSVYRKWLDYLKTSTPTPGNNVTSSTKLTNDSIN